MVLWIRALIACSLLFSQLALAQSLPGISQKTKVLGRELSVKSQARILPGGDGLQSSLESVVFGKKNPLISVSAQDGHSELYLRGIRVWSGSMPEVSIPPTRINLPLLNYPIGPILLQLSGGIEFSGTVKTSVIPASDSGNSDPGRGAEALVDISSSAFLEGTGGMTFFRGGIAGRVSLVDGILGARALLPEAGVTPEFENLGKATFLQGEIGGHLDSRYPFGSWNRLYSKTFFKWPGRCISFGSESCLVP